MCVCVGWVKREGGFRGRGSGLRDRPAKIGRRETPTPCSSTALTSSSRLVGQCAVASDVRRPRSRSEKILLRQAHTPARSLPPAECEARGSSALKREPGECKLMQVSGAQEPSRTLSTRAGQLSPPPASSLRNGATTRLELNGTVSGVTSTGASYG